MSDNNEPRFSPRPEAHFMKWEQLMSPVRYAIRDLLHCLDGATHNGGAVGESANCFLVYGDRGTGKTTVLLSAKYACTNPNTFFEKSKEAPSYYCGNDEEKKRRSAEESAGRLSDIVWLDVLDLEPLPSKTNLLTTVLTRVLKAVEITGDEKLSEPTSIFEDKPNSARRQLKALINDASLMWEDIHEEDTRSIANRQISAADIYSQFHEKFQQTMDRLSLELGRRKTGTDKHVAIVLPIDNIDRSTDHLIRVVKLGQMVLSPRLRLVMAGDRQDVDTFLERAYWKELIRIGEVPGSIGKTGPGQEDEALVMARRQSAAALHKLLPPSHRVVVESVKPSETLLFEFFPSGEAGLSGERNTIRQLLEQIPIPKVWPADPKAGYDSEGTKTIGLFDVKSRIEKALYDAASGEQGPHPTDFTEIAQLVLHSYKVPKASANDTNTDPDPDGIKLIDLFDPKSRIKKALYDVASAEQEPDITDFTEAAHLALRLPARGVLDLWQKAYSIVKAEPYNPDTAPSLVRAMLRNTISESTMPSAMGQYLQDHIIRQSQGATMLDFEDHQATHNSLERPKGVLDVSRLVSLDFEFHMEGETGPKHTAGPKAHILYEVRSWLEVYKAQSIVLRLQYAKERQEMLPDVVAGWLIVLHDVLVWAEDLSVIGNVDISPSVLVCCDYQGVRMDGAHHKDKELHLKWPLPAWDNFVSHDICRRFWRHFESRLLKTHTRLFDEASSMGFLPRLLATGWVACILETFLLFAQKHHDPEHSVLNATLSSVAKLDDYTKENNWDNEAKQHLQTAETNVMGAAADCYAKVRGIGTDTRRAVYDAQEGAKAMIDWLEWKLPLLLSPLYVPTTEKDRTAQITKIINVDLKNRGGGALAHQWRTRAAYISAELEKNLLEGFPGAIKSVTKLRPASTHLKRAQDLQSLRSQESLGCLCDLSWLNDDPKVTSL
jgi:hypothetical protein